MVKENIAKKLVLLEEKLTVARNEGNKKRMSELNVEHTKLSLKRAMYGDVVETEKKSKPNKSVIEEAEEEIPSEE